MSLKFGPIPPKTLPEQDPLKVLRMAERWARAFYAHSKWAEGAKQCTDFLEGRQFTEQQMAEAKRKGRPLFKFNIIAPLVRIVLGYQANNKTDIQFQPGHDALATEEVAEALNRLEKAVATDSELDFVDAEVFLEGLTSGRGWYDTRLSWDSNDFGEAATISADPFTIYPDPDANTYDLNRSAAFMQEAKFVSIDEIEAGLGKKVAELARPWVMGQTPQSPVTSILINDEITPIRSFGMQEAGLNTFWDQFYALQGDFVDTHRKTLRIIHTQHKVREERNVVIDLETGDTKVLPADWTADRIAKIMLWAEEVGNPVVVQNRMVERIQWTTTLGDLMLYDTPSYYDGYTYVGYFPYFRRGVTRGMVEDLVDPQKDKNKSRNARIEIMAKTANGGWTIHEQSMSPTQEANLKKFGSVPGVVVKWKGEKEPKVLQGSVPPMGYERMERQDAEDAKLISGINEAALGEIETVQSGRALEARQRQAVVSVQSYMANLVRSKRRVGRQHLAIFQGHYTEKRIYRITGQDSKMGPPLLINDRQIDMQTGVARIVNDITVGKYSVFINPAPFGPSFEAAQFEEMMVILEKLGPAIGPMLPNLIDLILGMSTMPRKQEWIDRIQALMGVPQPQPGAPPPDGGGQPQGHPQGVAPAGLIAPPMQATGHENVVQLPQRTG